MQERPGTLRQRDGRACVCQKAHSTVSVSVQCVQGWLAVWAKPSIALFSKPSRGDKFGRAPPAQTRGLGAFSSAVGQSMTNRPSPRPCAHWPDRDDFVHNAGLMSWH
jgi:hypothetical protein